MVREERERGAKEREWEGKRAFCVCSCSADRERMENRTECALCAFHIQSVCLLRVRSVHDLLNAFARLYVKKRSHAVR